MIFSFLRVNAFKASYGLGYASLLRIVWIASATTAQLFSKSESKACLFINSLFRPLIVDDRPRRLWAKGTPIFLRTVLSVKSLWSLLIGNLALKCS